MPHATALFALSLTQYQRRLHISRVKNIGNVFELSGVAFRPAAPYGGLLVTLNYTHVTIRPACFFPTARGKALTMAFGWARQANNIRVD